MENKRESNTENKDKKKWKKLDLEYSELSLFCGMYKSEVGARYYYTQSMKIIVGKKAQVKPTVKFCLNQALPPKVSQTFIIKENSKLADYCRLEQGAKIGANCDIGRWCKFRRNAIVADGATLGSNVQLSSGAIIGENAVAGHDVWLGKKAVVGKRARIGAHVTICEGANIPEETIVECDVTVPKYFDLPVKGQTYQEGALVQISYGELAASIDLFNGVLKVGCQVFTFEELDSEIEYLIESHEETENHEDGLRYIWKMVKGLQKELFPEDACK